MTLKEVSSPMSKLLIHSLPVCEGLQLRGPQCRPSEPRALSTLLEGSHFACSPVKIPWESAYWEVPTNPRGALLQASKKHWLCISLSQRCTMGKDFCPSLCGFTLTLHQFDPEVGNEEEQQQSHRQEDPGKQEPAGALSQEGWQPGAHCQPHGPPGQVGFTLQMRAALLRVCTSFLLGLWPLLSTSRWNFLWTLLYLNSPVSSEKTAVRLLCNSAAKHRGIERWFSQTIPERRVHRAGLGTTPEASTSLYSVYLERKVPDFK